MVDQEERALQSRKWQLIGKRANGAAVQMRPLPTLMEIGLAVAASKHTTAPINHTRPSPSKHSPDVTTSSQMITDIQLLLTTHLSTSKE